VICGLIPEAAIFAGEELGVASKRRIAKPFVGPSGNSIVEMLDEAGALT